MAAPFDGREVPTALGSIYGYRYWYLVGGELVSVSAHDPLDYGKKAAWVDGENVAVCNRVLDERRVGIPPKEPEKPAILQQDSDTSDFFTYVKRAKMKSSSGWSFPVTSAGDYVMPQFGSVGSGAAYDRVREEAEELYQERLATYHEKLNIWRTNRAAVMAEMAEEHPVPVLGCTCGFYMVKDHHFARKTYTQANPEHSLILGIVEGYGKVVMGEKGWRFEKARIRGLVCSIEFIRSHVRYELNRENKRIDLKGPTVEAYNNFRQRYSDPEFYDSEKEFFDEWDEKVKAPR